MENDTDKLIAEQLNKFPKELRETIESVPWKSSIKEIALLNKIPLEQVEIIERETMFILYGFENPADYIGNIMREAQINEEAAISIAEAVNEKILKVITLKVNELSKGNSSNATPMPEPSHPNLPMVEEGEVAHDVPHIELTTDNRRPTTSTEKPLTNDLQPTTDDSKKEEKPRAAALDVRYPGGKDPYREPLV